MCLTIPKQILSIKNGVVKLTGKSEKSASSIIKVKKGDWVLMQNNVIIKKITKKQALEINKLLNDYSSSERTK